MKKTLPFLLALFSFLSISLSSSAQIISVYPDTVLCGSGTVRFFPDFFPAQYTTSYTVDNITYAPPVAFNTGTSYALNIDDTYSDTIDIGFKFCFFGNTYTKCLISSNGYITFNIASAGLYSPWPIGAPIPSASDPTNSIMFPWQDIDPSVGGQIFYQTVGTAPFRKFIVSYYHVPYFSCNSVLFTGMMVINETTNYIETYTENKDICMSWNGGAAIHGIQNSTGTLGYTVPGRNYPTNYTDILDAWRFTPDGGNAYDFHWIVGGVPISTDSVLPLTLDTSTTMIGQLVYLCTGDTFSDSARVAVGEFLYRLPNDTICLGDSVQIFVAGVPTAHWDPGIGLSDTVGTSVWAHPSVTTTYHASYTCIHDTFTIWVAPHFALHACADTSICLGEQAQLYCIPNDSIHYRYNWYPGFGTTNPYGSMPLTTTYYVNGSRTSYTYQVAVTSNLGCTEYDSTHVLISGRAPAVVVTATDTSVCPGTMINLHTSALALPCGVNPTPIADFICDPANVILGAVGTGSITSGPTPYPGTTDARFQMIFRASELHAAGFRAGTITDMYFDWASNSGMVINNLNVKMGCIDAIEFKAPYQFIPGLATVASIPAYTPSGAPAPLDNYYDWDGYSNLIVEMCFDAPGSRAGDVPNSTNTGFNSVLNEVAFSASTVGCTLSSPTVSMIRPNTHFIMCASDTGTYSYHWTPITRLSCDTCQNPNAMIITPYDYNVRVFDGRCTGTGSIHIGIDSALTLVVPADTSVCVGDYTGLFVQANLGHRTCIADYRLDTIPYAPEATTGGTAILLSDDQLSAAQPLGFTFNFYCQPITSVKICSNGWIGFDPAEFSTSLTPQTLPDPFTPNSIFAFAWGDLSPNGVPIHVQTIGTAPNRKFVIDFDSISNLGTGDYVFAQIVLSEGTDLIEVHYRAINGPWSRTCGVEDATGTTATFDPAMNNLSTWYMNNQSLRFTPAYHSADSIVSIRWSPSIGLDDSTSATPHASPPTDTRYVVQMNFLNGCPSYDTVVVMVGPHGTAHAAPDTVFRDGTTTVYITTPDGPYTYLWQPSARVVNAGDSSTPTNSLHETTTFYAHIISPHPRTNGDTCQVIDSVTVYVIERPSYIFPDAFTPNNDGMNDYFFPVIQLGGTASVTEFKVFNRWGELVYNDNKAPGWNGTFMGTAQPIGTYIYSAKIRVPDPQNPSVTSEVFLQGSVSLIR